MHTTQYYTCENYFWAYLYILVGIPKFPYGQEQVERCQAVAGLSLGEYTALAVAGVFDFETGLKVVKLRGEAMQARNGSGCNNRGITSFQESHHISWYFMPLFGTAAALGCKAPTLG